MNPALITAFATAYTEQELREKIITTAQQVAESPTLITSASTGGGSSYSRVERISVSDLLTCYVMALKMKLGEPLDTGAAQSYPINFTRAD